jgi:uncharacterized protein (DUF4415 family)
MKWRNIMAIVRYTPETLPPVSEEDRRRAGAIREEDIDCSDIGEVRDFSAFRPFADRRLYKPVKVAITCNLDADIVAWLKREGKGYQTRLNAILRKEMMAAR